MKKAISIKIAGESGQGINSIGEVLTRALKRSGYFVFGYREYPSIIKGGYASYQIDICDEPINSSSHFCNVLLALSRVSLHQYLPSINKKGTVLHDIDQFDLNQNETELLKAQQAEIIYAKASQQAVAVAGKKIAANVVLTGMVWKLLGLETSVLTKVLGEQFAHKPELIPANEKCLVAGYNYAELPKLDLLSSHNKRNDDDDLLISGNDALSLGAIAAGTRAYYSYPMTPSSSILTYFANTYKKTGVIVKQAEDEITAVQMAIGSMYMGTRALVATSGGGFDLMTETISLAGITETPLVVVLGQRPGPATGMPTWTSQGDLNLAIYAGHGELPRAVMAVSTVDTAYSLVQSAFNIAEKYQIPVILLTDKLVAESLFQIDKLPHNIPVERGLSDSASEERYQITPSGVSSRWLPGTSDKTYVGNSDEHWEDGTLTEEADKSRMMHEKRMRKLVTLEADLPEPTLFGNKDAQKIIVGWGSVKNVVLDVLPSNMGYLHFDYLYPLKTQLLTQLHEQGKQFITIEQNFSGQFAKLIRQETGIKARHEIKKYDGRPFWREELINILTYMK